MEDNVAFLSSDSNRAVYLGFIKHQVIKVTEIVRVRKSLHGMSTAGNNVSVSGEPLYTCE